ncbi:Vacuolar iron transporter 1 [Asimina triloba]
MAEEDGRSRMSENLLLQHEEKHFTASDVVRDIIIGVSDGLTVPFALAAGLSGASASSSIILTAGLAEVAAGAISMGLGGLRRLGGNGNGMEPEIGGNAESWKNPGIKEGGILITLLITVSVKEDWTLVRQLEVGIFQWYLAAKSEADHYMRELKREQEEIISVPETEAAEVAEILSQYGLEAHEYGPVVNSLRKNPRAWLEFMMRFELGLEKPKPRRALQSALTIAISYIVGGLVPLIPYMFIRIARNAVLTSVAVTLISLLFFGYVKGRFTGTTPIKSAFQTAFIGAIASAAAFGIARAVQT